MTSHQKSSVNPISSSSYSNVESLAGVFHPHAIEVQDFSHYSQIIDLRSQAEYENDHIPGAVRVEPPDGDAFNDEATWRESLTSAVAPVVPIARSRRPVLLYCGDAGRLSRRAGEALRSRGLTVEVLPGGWINYRRWVQAGLELLPRLVTFRVISSSTGEEGAMVLQALRDTGRQVLDLERLAVGRTDSNKTTTLPKREQAWFESQLLNELRSFDPRHAVWTNEVSPGFGKPSMPGALSDSLAMAPLAPLQIDASAARLTENAEQLEQFGAMPLMQGADHQAPFPSASVAHATGRLSERKLLPALRLPSLQPKAVAAALASWLPAVEPRLDPG